MDYIRPMILNLGSGCIFNSVEEVSAFLWTVINILWDKRMPQLLYEFLSSGEFEILIDQKDVKSKLKSLLFKSCRHESDFDSPMVKVLVHHGERLTLRKRAWYI